jgi:DNA-binding NarL/FixJ family response regulator/signal transduction histidine kinase
LEIYLTPAALSYLTQLILATLISLYFSALTQRQAQPPSHLYWLTAFFWGVAAFVAALFLEAALPATPRLPAVFWQIPLLAVSWFCLVQFAYRFPALPPPLRREARLVSALVGLYAIWEIGFVVHRYRQLSLGLVEYRIDWTDYLLLAVLLVAPLVFLRKIVHHCPAPDPSRFWLLRLGRAWRRPTTPACRALRDFSLIFLFVAALGVFNLLRTYYHISVALANAGISFGILIALTLFALAYVNQREETTSFMVRLVGITLTTMLGILGVAGWAIASPHVADHAYNLDTPRALRFTPTTNGGYEITAIPFLFESDLGQNLYLDDGAARGCSDPLAFRFPFYDEVYDVLYVCNDGLIAPGAPIRYREYQYNYGAGAPLLLPLLTDLDPTSSQGGVFARQEGERLIVTWDRLRLFQQPEKQFTAQAVLYADGIFDFVYAAAPERLAFQPNDNPGASLWAIGALPGERQRMPPKMALLDELTLSGPPVVAGPDGALQDFYLEFRADLHRLLVPLAWLILAASAFILSGFPLLFYVSLVQPLRALLAGVRRMEAGEYGVAVPVPVADEIGLLSRAFNRLSGELGDLIHTLEERVAERTAAVDAANSQLRAEMEKRERAQDELLAQQRRLARLEEREEIGRELHDGLAQVLGYVSMQAQAVETLIGAGQPETAVPLLTQLARVAQDAHADTRQYILGMRPAAPGQNFIQTLQSYAEMLAVNYGLQVNISAPTWPSNALTAESEAQLWRIIQEALTNIRKHAGTEAAQVICTLQGDQAQIIIADHGRGFTLPDAPAAGHFGLTIMRERAEALGGAIAWQSAPGQGTQVVVTLPRHTPPVADNGQTAVPLRVVIVDDHPMFREGLHNLLTAHGVQVVGLGGDGLQAQELAQLQPDVMLLDMNMPHSDGLQATQRIKAQNPHLKIVILTVEANEGMLFAALQAGASGYLLKNVSGAELLTRLKEVMRGETVISSGLAAQALHEFARQAAPSPDMPMLSSRQAEILNLLADGLTYKEIARREAISERTVRYHVGQIVELLQVNGRREAIALARQYGIDKLTSSE